MSEMDYDLSFNTAHVGRLVTVSHKTDTSKKVRKVIMKVRYLLRYWKGRKVGHA